jgi:hypothetical protein
MTSVANFFVSGKTIKRNRATRKRYWRACGIRAAPGADCGVDRPCGGFGGGEG